MIIFSEQSLHLKQECIMIIIHNAAFLITHYEQTTNGEIIGYHGIVKRTINASRLTWKEREPVRSAQFASRVV